MRLVELYQESVLGVLEGLDRVRFRGTDRMLSNIGSFSRALYTDHASVYISGKEPSVEEQLRGEESLTRRSGCSPAEPYPPTRQHYSDVSFTFWQEDIFNELAHVTF